MDDVRKDPGSHVRFGYTISSEEHDPVALVEHAVAGEQAGFEFLSVSDHFHPWVSAQGHSPFVWSVLGAMGQATERCELAVGVTCPIMRMHPALVAHAAATTSLLADGRFTLGLGTGEALNEHIIGARWPSAPVRLEMLDEAVEIIRRLFTGETIDHRGRWFEVENAKLFDPPAADLPIIISAFGPKAAATAGRIGDGLWATSPDGEACNEFEAAGGRGPRYSQVTVCWSDDTEDARSTVYRRWPNGGIPGQLSQDLPTWVHFEQAASIVDRDQATDGVPCGPDPQPYVELVEEHIEAGFDHIYFHQVGSDQAGFLDFWTRELGPALESLGR